MMRWFMPSVIVLIVAGVMFAEAATSPTQAPKTVGGYFVVTTCGTLVPALTAGTYAAGTIDINGQFCVNK